MKSFQLSLATIVTALLILPACGPQKRHVSSKKPLVQKTILFEETKDGITLKLTQADTLTLEDIAPGTKTKLAQNGILPIELTVTNNSSSHLRFCPLQKNIPFAAPHKVRAALHSRAYYLVPAILVTTLFLTLTGICAAFYITTLGLGNMGTSIFFYSILFPTGGMLMLGSGGSLLLHKKLDKNYQKMNKALCHKSQVTIEPNNQFKAILLLDAHKLPSEFDVHVHDANHTATVFNIPTVVNTIP